MKEEFSAKDGVSILRLARRTIRNELAGIRGDEITDTSGFSTEIRERNRGIFVSLHKNGNLRGCIGNLAPVKTVFEGVIDNAKHAAFNDSRFSPLSFDELDDTVIEVSILTRPEKIEYIDGQDLIAKIRPDIDGVIIKKGHRTATFLPQVWHQLKDPREFLSHLCMKAGLTALEWETGGLDISLYQVQSFEEKSGKGRNRNRDKRKKG